MMSTFTNNIRKIINRNKKYIINLAVAESVKYGANVYEFRLDEAADHDEENERKQSQQITFPEEEVAKVVTERLKGMSEQIKNMLDEEINPTKTWMKELQEQLIMRSMEWDSKYDQVRKQMTDNEAKMQLEEKHVQRTLTDLRERQGQLEAAVSFYKDYVKDILNFSSVINHIVIQDEIDRQGTALYALKSSKNS